MIDHITLEVNVVIGMKVCFELYDGSHEGKLLLVSIHCPLSNLIIPASKGKGNLALT